MSYFRERIFLDYMDFHTGNAQPLATLLKDKEIKLKLDILAFPKAQFCVAAPAIAKCHDTAYLLGRYSSLWSTNRLKYVLDPRYQGNFSVYVDERIKKLQSSFREDSLWGLGSNGTGNALKETSSYLKCHHQHNVAAATFHWRPHREW